MKRSKSIEFFSLRNPRKWRPSHFLFAVAAVYCLFVTFRFRRFLSIDGRGGGLDRPQFSSAYHEILNRKLSSDTDQDPPPKPVDDPLVARARISYGRIAGDSKRRRYRKFSWSGNLTRLDAMVSDARKLGAKAWEELESYRRSGNLKLEHLFDGKKMESCPTSVTLDGKKSKKLRLGLETEEVMFLPCGLEVGSSITVIGMPEIAHREHVPELFRSRRGDGSVMVSQFMVELQGLKAVDGEDPPRILHFNPRLKGDWSKRPVIELNTCYRMQWGKSMRCNGVSSKGDDDTVDGFNKCEKWERSDTADMKESRTTSWFDRFIGRAMKPEMTWPFPFVEGKLFVMTLQAGLEGYHIYVGGRHVTSFPYRPGFILEDATGLAIKGNVDVHSVYATSLPTSHTSFSVQNVLEMSEKWKSLPLPQGPVHLFIGILSATNHFAERMAVRKTWMQYPDIKSSYVVARFIVALGSQKEVNALLKMEAEYFGDIVILPFIDHYELVVLKTIAICEYGIFKMEDVSMGMWVEEFNTSTRVQYSHSWRFCQYGCMENYYTAHYQSPRQMICLWDKLSRGQVQCCNF